MNNYNNEYNVKLKKMLALRIVTIILLALATAFTVSFIPDIIAGIREQQAGNNNIGVGLGVGIGLAVMLIYGLISYAPACLVSIIGIVVSAIKYKRGTVTKGTVVFFVCTLIITLLLCVGIYLFVGLIN